jgi:acyl-CoA synthetase (AMP-forming)/AMP-acid ligase II
VVIENRTSLPRLLLEEMERTAVTGFSGVPASFQALLSRGGIEDFRLPRLSYLTSAGGHLPQRAVESLLRALPGVDLYLMYGATEAAARIAYLPPARLADKPGSIGIPIDGVEMKVVKNGRRAAAREVGEIWARGDCFSRGYWCSGGRIDGLLIEGWFRTGDLGFEDEEGFFTLTGRTSELIKVSGHRVSALAIERALYALPGVAECAVVGRPDGLTGERAVAFVMPAGAEVSAAGLMRRLRQTLPWFEVPARIELVAALPRNGSGKVDKRRLGAAGAGGR